MDCPQRFVLVASDSQDEETQMSVCGHVLQEMVHQSILTNQIPRAQAVLRRRSQPEQGLVALRAEGQRQVFSCLQRRDLQTATTLLANMVRTSRGGQGAQALTQLACC